MCLITLSTTLPPEDFIGIGYKVGRIYRNRFITGDKQYQLNFNEWNTDISDFDLVTQDGNFYRAGFHVFEKLEDAQRYCQDEEVIVSVEYKQVVAMGKQRFSDYHFCNVSVARQIRVLHIM